MKKLCSVTQKVEELGFFKKSQLGRKKMLEKNTEEEMSSGKTVGASRPGAGDAGSWSAAILRSNKNLPELWKDEWLEKLG